MHKIGTLPNNVISKIGQEIFVSISNALRDENLAEVELYDEIKKCKQREG